MNKTYTFNAENVNRYDTERLHRLYQFAYGESLFNPYQERQTMIFMLLSWSQRMGAFAVAAMLGVDAEAKIKVVVNHVEGSKVDAQTVGGVELWQAMVKSSALFRAMKRNYELTKRIESWSVSERQIRVMRYCIKNKLATYRELQEWYNLSNSQVWRAVHGIKQYAGV